LGISLVIFAMTGVFNSTPLELALLVGVLLFHEAGHYVGMRIFNYQDVRMFFIPFFGAAVSGRNTSVEGYKEAIVLLLGPLPGIVLGIGAGIVCMFHDSPILRSATIMLLAINAFNLLPLLPLDGGRLVHLILFSRQRHLEAIFRVITAVLLGLGAVALQAWLLLLVAVFMLFGTRLNYVVSSLALQFRQMLPPDHDADLSQQIPRERALPIIERLRAAFPQITQPATLAGLVRQVWERMHVQPPGVLASLLLLTIHGGAFLGTPVAAMLFQMPLRSVESGPDGVVRLEEVRVWGRLRTSTELDANGRRHGRFVEYFPKTGRVSVEGRYFHGEREGVWTYYREDGSIDSQEQLKPVRLGPMNRP
jgi:Zn-dependent protease